MLGSTNLETKPEGPDSHFAGKMAHEYETSTVMGNLTHMIALAGRVLRRYQSNSTLCH
jgi:hypothetical protein